MGQRALGRERVLLALGVALVVAAVVVWFAPWQLTVLGAWDGGAAVYLGTVWASLGGVDATTTRDVATVEDASRGSSRLVLLAASSASLVAVGFALVDARRQHGVEEALSVAASVVTIASAWAVVHTVYALHYAHRYYSDPPGGVDFPGGDDPRYADFAYLAFTVGMTYQVSDTSLLAPRIRHEVLGHALLSFVFGTVILATVVNGVASIIG
jgi:uncharacterized membrane protein